MSTPRRRTVWRRCLVTFVGMVLVVSCAKATSTNRGSLQTGVPPEVRASDIARSNAGSVSTAALVNGIAAFGHDLYGQAAAGGGNVVYSPLSIAVALSMARVGAGGTTASQIDSVMHFPAADRDAAMNALTQALATRDTAPPVASPAASRSAGSPPEDPILTIANGIFVEQGQPIGAPFLQTLAADYGAGVQAADFRSPSATAQINAWVRTQTAQRIQQLFDSIDPSTLVVLANAVYLKADWAVPFAEDPTSSAPFTTAGGGQIRVPTMHQSGTLGYAAADGWQAVSIPYAGGTLAMWVIVPTGSSPLADLLAPSTLSSVAAGLKPTDLALSLPRWKSTTNLNLDTALQHLGMTEAFSPTADFSGIYPGLYIGQAVHRATITVDEWGTEAAAVTGLAFPASSRMAPTITVNADHPFAYAIVNLPTGAVVFEGSVADPTAG
jgi:serine protease inhibitor